MPCGPMPVRLQRSVDDHPVVPSAHLDHPVVPSALLADGGASRNDALMQFQADMLGCPVIRNDSADLSACGAAWLAGLAIGVWPSMGALAELPRHVIAI